MDKYTAKIMNSYLSKDIIKHMKRQIQGRRICVQCVLPQRVIIQNI